MSIVQKLNSVKSTVPHYWPIGSFIHHNPLHGLENLPLEQAVEQGSRLFHARSSLPRVEYQRFLEQDKVDRDALLDLVNMQIGCGCENGRLCIIRHLLKMTAATFPKMRTARLNPRSGWCQNFH